MGDAGDACDEAVVAIVGTNFVGVGVVALSFDDVVVATGVVKFSV